MINFTNLFVSLFYSGYFKKWPGTFASLISILILYPIIELNIFSKNIFIYIFIFIFIISIYFINKFSNFTKTHDSGIIVIDEFLGQSIPIILYETFHPNRSNTMLETLQIYFWFFLLFRLFDGLKPFPIDYIDKKFKNTFGIIFDDILAGFYVVICLVLFMVGKTFFNWWKTWIKKLSLF